MSTRLALAATLALAAGCAEQQPPAPVDLRAATGHADLRPSGIAVDPTGARYLLDDHLGLFRLGAGGAFDLVLARAAMSDLGVPAAAPLTDLVAIGPGRFALTALGEGYLLDLGLGTLHPYFGSGPDARADGHDQRTDAVAYDADARLLYAQPRTFDAGNHLLASQVASYSLATGADLQWFDVTDDVAAGGMAKVPGVAGLVLGVDTGLCLLFLDDVDEVIDLAPLGIVGIDGLALDRAAGTLLVVDGDAAQLLELELDSVFP